MDTLEDRNFPICLFLSALKMNRFWKKRPVLRLFVGIFLILLGVIWIVTPIPGAAIPLVSGLYLCNEKWAKEKIQYFRQKFKRKK